MGIGRELEYQCVGEHQSCNMIAVAPKKMNFRLI